MSSNLIRILGVLALILSLALSQTVKKEAAFDPETGVVTLEKDLSSEDCLQQMRSKFTFNFYQIWIHSVFYFPTLNKFGYILKSYI